MDVTHSSGTLAGGDKGVDVLNVDNVTLGIFRFSTPADTAESFITERRNVLFPFFEVGFILPFFLLWNGVAVIFDFNIINVNHAARSPNITFLGLHRAGFHLVVDVPHAQPHTPQLDD
jgi:hypothetical protein